MTNSEKWDQLLRQALAPAREPEEELNQSLFNRFKERNGMKSSYKKRISVGVLVAVFTLALSITAFAATKLFSSKQVAEHLGEHILAKAFESSGAIEINQSLASNGYNFTLHGIVSGKDLREFQSSTQSIYPDRTYAVVSIARQDGGKMPDTADPEYGKEPFFISPLIKGQKPWQVNIITMNGGYSEVVLDGIMYRLIECDGVEMFADRGVYLAVSSGSIFYDTKAFAYDERTGEVSPRTDYKGASLLFDLPLDKAKADHGKAEAYLRELLKEPTAGTAADPAASVNDAEADMVNKIKNLKKKIPDGTVIPESIKKVTYDDKGMINYEYDGWSGSFSPGELFVESQTGFSDVVLFSGDGHGYKALQFSRDEDGVITGRVIILNSGPDQ